MLSGPDRSCCVRSMPGKARAPAKKRLLRKLRPRSSEIATQNRLTEFSTPYPEQPGSDRCAKTPTHTGENLDVTGLQQDRALYRRSQSLFNCQDAWLRHRLQAASQGISSGRRKVKGNMDIEFAVDAMELAEHVDQIVLFSGDGDFRSVVEAVQRRGVRVTVVSTISSQPPMIADELRRQADVFTDLVELQSKLGRGLFRNVRELV